MPKEFNDTFGYLRSRASKIPRPECDAYYGNKGLSVSDNQLCYGNSIYLAPDSCQIEQGGSLERKYYAMTSHFYTFQIGINNYGNDCGYGYPMVATQISKYIDWIDSLIFAGSGELEQHEEKLKINDSCILPGGVTGMCKKSSQCQDVVLRTNRGQTNFYEYECDFSDNSDPVVCCPPPKDIFDFSSKAFIFLILYFGSFKIFLILFKNVLRC